MCSWCWAFRPVWDQLLADLPENISVQKLLGGLAPDNEEPMAEEMQTRIQSIWNKIQKTVPGTEFNYDFWRFCEPRRSTYPACRAVISAVLQGKQYEDAMILGIQKAYYLYAKNPANDDVLIDLAIDLGLDAAQFRKDLNAPETCNALLDQIRQSQAMGIFGFPSLILWRGTSFERVEYDYNDPQVALRSISELAIKINGKPGVNRGA